MPVNPPEPIVVLQPPDTGGTAQALCRSCGFCCDGTLFSSVSVCDPDVIPPLAKAGIKIVAHDTERSFRQPCAAHDGRSCRVYADRPSNCREFRCKLLADLESGRVDRPHAFERIRQVSALKEAVKEELQRIEPAMVGTSLPELRKLWLSVDDPVESLALRRKYGTVLVCIVALAWYVDKHFLDKRAVDDPTNEFSEKRNNAVVSKNVSW